MQDCRGGLEDGALPVPRAPDTALRGWLRDLENERRRFGDRRLFILLRREGAPSGINRIYRLCSRERLTVVKKG
jgi:putative transposase